MSRVMAIRSMTSSTMLIIFLWSSGIIVSQGLPTTGSATTELFTGFSIEVTDTDAEGYEEETTTLPIEDDTVPMTTIDAITTSTSGEYGRITDACSICPEKMSCFSQGNECTSKCAGNENYCHHDHGECEEVPQRSTFIICKCEEGFTGAQCDRKIDHDEREADLYVGIIAASAISGIIVLAIILATCINLFNKRRIRTGRSEELFGIENVVALELVDEKLHFDGTATQTDESFLLARSHKDGVAPKAGHAHKIMQTNDSFLLAKAQLLRAHGSATRYRGAGSPVGVVSGNTRRLSDRPVGSKVSDADATPSTSTAGANGVARKPSTKKDRAPEPPQQNSASTSQDQEATPSTSKSEFSTPSRESAPKPADSPTENDEGNIEVPPPEKPISADGGDGMSDAYAGRKILKV